MATRTPGSKLTRTQPGRVKLAQWDYDFAVDGGAVGAITLRGDSIPSGSVVIDARVVVTSGVTSGGAATVSLDLETAADLRAANAYNNATMQLSTTGVKALLNAVKTTAVRNVVATVGTTTLTGGAFSVIVSYVET